MMSSSEVRTGLGEVFTVRLESNPTTGYSWTAEYDRDFLELMTEGYDRMSLAIGGGGYAIFNFLSLKRGRTTITMRYRRPWEDEVIKMMLFFVEVV
jgi:inhibitor of cysteine peptidase